MTPALDTLMLSLATHEGMAADRCLFLGARPHPELPATVTGWQPLKPHADAWSADGRPLLTELGDTRFPLVLILPGKSRDETLVWFATARDHLEPGGRIVVAMPNTAGAGRFEREFKKATREVTSIQKNKCRAFHADEADTWNATLFSEWRALGDPRTIPGTSLVTTAGIFSSQHIDPGSRLLADHLPANLHGRIADLGAGWGFLAGHALEHNRRIERIDLYEADSRALDCARHNLATHDTDIGYHWHDVRGGIDGRCDAILMNPPFHTGQATDVDLGRAFIATAAAALKPGGRLFMVANRQLPYERVLDSHHLRWHQAAEDPTFKLLFATKS